MGRRVNITYVVFLFSDCVPSLWFHFVTVAVIFMNNVIYTYIYILAKRYKNYNKNGTSYILPKTTTLYCIFNPLHALFFHEKADKVIGNGAGWRSRLI